jgi:hypothetical protein
MTVPPDAEQTEQDEALLEVLTEWAQVWPDPEDAARNALEGLQPVLAAIRRQAAADALKEQARAIGKTADFFRQQARAIEGKSMTSADIYRAMADQCNNDSNRLAKAARDVIAEGYEHTCAAQTWATRDDPGYGCDIPVPEAGDYCPRHEPEDDDDPRWAE